MLVSRQLPLLVSPAGSSLALIARLAVLQCRPTMSSFSTYSATAATLNKNDKNESNKKDSKKDNKKEEAETPSPLRLADEGTEHIRFFHEPQRLVDLLTRLPNYGIGMRFAHIKWDHDEAVKASYWTVSNIRISKSKHGHNIVPVGYLTMFGQRLFGTVNPSRQSLQGFFYGKHEANIPRAHHKNWVVHRSHSKAVLLKTGAFSFAQLHEKEQSAEQPEKPEK